MAHIETCNIGPKSDVLNAQNCRGALVPIETSNSGDKHAFFHAQNDR